MTFRWWVQHGRNLIRGEQRPPEELIKRRQEILDFVVIRYFL